MAPQGVAVGDFLVLGLEGILSRTVQTGAEDGKYILYPQNSLPSDSSKRQREEILRPVLWNLSHDLMPGTNVNLHAPRPQQLNTLKS